jgi:7,8-dihydropterin-6-yl-methyl-4-(beta-D-ribofuranosyl)aminobenzene 5'-phosphate synthase
MSRRYDITLTSAPYKLSEDVIFLGEIPRINDFEAQTTAFEKENGQSDFVMDDSAIVITDKQGLIVVTGCSHAGICNIIEHARVVTGIDHVHTVIGGFHLKHNNRQTRLTIEYMRAHGIKNIYPSHCTRLPALTEFYNAFKTEQVKTGSVFEF